MSSADRVVRINGTIHNVATGDKTPFKVWYERGREIPLRFEYKARTFLNLAFHEAQQSGALCLQLSSATVGLINTGLFKTFFDVLAVI